MRAHTLLRAACSTLLAAHSVSAITLNVTDDDSIKDAAAQIAYRMVQFYVGNESGQTPGLLPSPYYWWEAGAMWGSLIDYWYYTGDDTYNNITYQALQFQVGSDDDYMPANQTTDLGNDDQDFWGMAAMTAAEVNFTNPPSDEPQWLALAQAVFNEQAARWDTSTCGGGLRWQIFTFNDGYDYKNSISNGCFFQMGARLAAYTGNTTYSDWAEKVWDWVTDIGLVSTDYYVYDGTEDTSNCTSLDHEQWTYNAGTFLHGAAVMWNVTSDEVWKNRTLALWNASSIFFTGTDDQVMYELTCEPSDDCDTDELSFKAYLSRWMAAAYKVAPFLETETSLLTYLKTSAAAAAATCTGGTDANECSSKWTVDTWDGTVGVGQQMSALEVVQALLINTVSGPLSNSTGGTSTGDSSAGTTTSDDDPTAITTVITTGDRAGAGIMTIIVAVGVVAGACWMII